MNIMKSEEVEPLAARMLGLGFKRFEDKVKDWKAGKCTKDDAIEQANTWWNSMQAFDDAMQCMKEHDGELCHFSIAMSNQIRGMATIIETELGFCPLSIVGSPEKLPESWYVTKHVLAHPKYNRS